MTDIQEILATNISQFETAPERFNQITKQTLIQLAKFNNTHNKLLSSETICHLLNSLSQLQPFQQNKDTIQFTFNLNLIRSIINANFSQLTDNKIHGLICMIFAKALSNYNQKVIEQQKSYIVMKETSKCLVINQIMLRLAQRSRFFFPQYFKILLNMLKKIKNSFERNLKSLRKTTIQIQSNQSQMLKQILNLSYLKQTDKKQIISYLSLLFQYILLQASNFYKASFNKKELLKLEVTRQIIVQINLIHQLFPSGLKNQIVIPNQFKNYEELTNAEMQNQTIYLEQPIEFKELTPRFYNQQQSVILKNLRHKKSKMEKKMHLALKRSIQQKLQEQQVVDDVKKDKINRQQKKEMFVVQKQTQQAKKYHRMTKKVKSIKKQSKLGRKGDAGRGKGNGKAPIRKNR